MHTNNINSGNSQPGQARHDRAAICNWKYISKIHRIHRTFVWHRNGSCARCGKFDRRTDERQRDMLFAYTAFASDIENMEKEKKMDETFLKIWDFQLSVSTLPPVHSAICMCYMFALRPHTSSVRQCKCKQTLQSKTYSRQQSFPAK